MAEYPSIGISEEELLLEFCSEIEKCQRIQESSKVYTDVKDNLNQIRKGDIPASKKLAEIIGDNFGEFWRKHVELDNSYARVSILFDLCKKYFPESEILENPKFLNYFEAMKIYSELIKKNLSELIASDLSKSISDFGRLNPKRSAEENTVSDNVI